MKLLLDEDSVGKRFVRLLRDAGQDIETVIEAEMAGSTDADVLAYAVRTTRIVLTRNVRDFFALHQANPDHSGILVEYQDADPTKNMTYEMIVSAIAKIESSRWDLNGQFAALNEWR